MTAADRDPLAALFGAWLDGDASAGPAICDLLDETGGWSSLPQEPYHDSAHFSLPYPGCGGVAWGPTRRSDRWGDRLDWGGFGRRHLITRPAPSKAIGRQAAEAALRRALAGGGRGAS